MSNFLTIEEAKALTGKSDKTLRRLIGQLSSQASTQRLVKKDDKGRWLISSKYLRQESDQADDQVNDQAMSSHLPSHDLAIFQDKVLDIMKAQLEEKDRQIEQLNERLREAHILNRDLQQRLLPVQQLEQLDEESEQAAPEQEANPTVIPEVKQPEKPTKNRSLWKIILRAISQ